MLATQRRSLLNLALCCLVACCMPASLMIQAAFAENAVDSGIADVKLVPAAPKQGQTLSVIVSVNNGVPAPEVTFNKKIYKLYALPAGGTAGGVAERSREATVLRALIGVPADLPPGSYELTLGNHHQNVQVLAGGFGVQKIRLPKEKDNFVSSPGEEQAVHDAKLVQTPEQRWQGTFIHPSKARTSTQFGLRRMVNGHMLADYFHSGLDFAAGMGTPVLSTQNGRVVLAHSGWRLHGNTVAIDHGQGVISFYIHLSKIEVKSGDFVKAGQEIGRVGATGRANGPHLHFSLYVNGDATNPLDWFAHKY